jgi:hypothetical protein
MTLHEIAEKLSLEKLTPALEKEESRDAGGGYVSDLLSDVLANAPENGILITVQVHMNVIAVALHADLAGVIFAMDRRPEEAVIARAAAESIPLFLSRESAFDLTGRLYELGLRGGAA